MISHDDLIRALSGVVGPSAVISSPDELRVYECDAYTVEKATPVAVVLPESTEQVAGVVRLCNAHRLPFVPRGAGTGLSGGCLPPEGGVTIGLSRMNRILDVDLENRTARVEAGLVNLWLTNEVAHLGYHYAPDPSSQGACTIGGNVAENSGGPHTLKYGVTTNHVLGLRMVLPDGEVLDLGGAAFDPPGYDLRGVVIGSEGTMGIVTEVLVRLTRTPQTCRTTLAIFDRVEDASQTVSDIIGRGIVPAALEMMDRMIIAAVEEAYHFGFPAGSEAALIVELDGLTAGIDRSVEQVVEIFRQNNARSVRLAQTEDERKLLWASRKGAFGAIGRLSPSYVTQDGVVPRTRLPEVLSRIAEIGARHALAIANVFHAGDGNLHPIILFDERDREQLSRVIRASEEVLKLCVEVGGTITGEHGIGVEKMNLMPLLFSPEDLTLMQRVRDVFNRDGLCNPGKVFPTSRSCVELQATRRAAAC
ncbi:MAG: glycolate oxidase subunit GlcD [Candidatus Handelsmanbacteria bacterium RIFCSPLOWO2_12_FULL_64_10]|uniref:Glycolate oxidase subunit GlcD n=1 Tax=Handelsmanbacteria sp. (strain RIFCSPLOWO2_12_FULL_64_10) TaxID=1817868 RepID=A0A1F6D3R0_HANXR|nr:MAG: glycolate oxidase subunit GlcD [Candidatus Handelsmanbacteria bacterium RIFCSPLOWO2_12_FULL_64_10]